MAGVYNGHILEFPTIRVDCFLPSSSSILLPSLGSNTSNDPHPYPYPLRPAPNAQLFLLTHVHSDHLLGLSDSFTGKIICSPVTKRMLLKLEPEIERTHLEHGVKEVRRLKYPGLRARIEGKGKDQKLVDRIEAVPYGYPREYEIGFEDGKPQRVTITLLDANHCPGSTMFLITSPDKAVLHTGDIRADKLFIQQLKREPALQQYLAPTSTYAGSANSQPRAGRRVLDRIYLDTSAMLGTGDMPDREPVLQDLVEQMSLYPPDTVFFLDTWCFGWEFVIREVSRYFGELIHIDRYKHSIYKAVETDPYLLACTTTDSTATRFHACERLAKCTECRRFKKGYSKPVYNLDKRIVNVNMVEIKEARWPLEHSTFLESLGRAAVGEGPWPYAINVPLARHSPLPELQNLVKLFKPKGVSPNAIVSSLKGLDYFLLPDFMYDCIAPSAYEGMIRECDLYLEGKYGAGYVEGLRKLQMQRTKIQDDETGTTPLKLAGSQSASRRAVAKDQIFRAGGLPSLTPDELVKMVFDSISVTTDKPAIFTRNASVHVDYDTDEESPRYNKRRRRRKGFVRDESESSGPEASPSVPLPVAPDHTPIKRDGPSTVNLDHEPRSSDLSGQPSITIDVKPSMDKSPISPHSPTVNPRRNMLKLIKGVGTKQRSRFSLGTEEQDRIRALMRKDRELLRSIGDYSEILDEGDTGSITIKTEGI
ncbi:hypothetical protein IAT40_000864 [Kwoniella sp. CBS 6097]